MQYATLLLPALLLQVPKISETWEAAPAAFKLKEDQKKFEPTVDIKEEKTVEIANRGLLLSKQEYKEGCKISFQWKWESEDKEVYPDHLVVALRTTGARRPQWSFEVEDGIIVRFNPAGDGFVELETAKKAMDSKNLTRSKEKVPLPSGVFHKIEVSDEGEAIVVKVAGKEVLRHAVAKADGSETRKVGIHNREPVAAKRKVSTLAELTVK